MNVALFLLLLAAGFVLAPLVNYLADVLPTERRLVVPRCAKCSKVRSFDDLFLNTKCRYCSHKNGLRHRLMYFLLPLLNVYLFFFNHPQINIWLSVLLLTYFTLVFITDLEHRLILHVTSLAGFLLAAIIGFLRAGFLPTLFGALTGFGIMYLFYLLGFVFIKVMNRRRREEPIDDVALGFGDVTLSTVLGALLGFPGIIAGLFFGILLGGLASATVLLIGFLNKKSTHLYALPYGPFLLVSAFVLLYLPFWAR